MSIGVTYYVGSEVYYLTPLVTSVTWSGDTTTASRQVEVSLINTLDGEAKAVSVTVGNSVRVYKDDREIFRGVIFETDVRSDGTFSFTAHDYNYYLTKNTDTMKFTNQKASQIIASICKKYGIAYGTIEDTGYVIPQLILRDKTIYDMITIALTETRKKTGKVFLLTNEVGKLVLRERKSQVVRLIISDSTNLINANYTESIEDLRNSVRITGKAGEDSSGVTVGNDASIKRYGLMREKRHESEMTDAQLTPVANALLAELNKVTKESDVEALGDTSVFAGKSVQVYERMTGISGGFYVITDSHTFDASGMHTMSLKVSHVLELNEIEYEAPEEEEASSTTIDGKKIDGIVYETGYIATAYAPALGGINGSGTGLTASSTKVDEGRTIAVDPTKIPLGSVVAVYVANAKEYSGLYLAEDTGGAIKGKKIDIAVVPSNAKAFGVKNVQVSILERGSGRADARNKAGRWSEFENKWTKELAGGSDSFSGGSDVRSNVVKLANSYKGKLKYNFGGKNIAGGSGDCSGFTQYVYSKAAGMDIGHGTSTQVTKGRLIPQPQAQAGDLVFFKGTYRAGVSHVGIVTRSGYCVSLASSGCKEHSYLTGYWGNHFMQVRRVFD
ncbi:C40 family peptidase [Peribacillus huizhouensis]|uniref:Cell wall-associated NlpC family hydrolase n=1 Tax=Peribacillus huizhouensis TaxID=1501239 RepID=A0ABR6CR57_9BACI|nr:NlpC/P60 family protein [Peribacillus huizhouensis]MBA9027512.1 cell wall-associated NlpC family hydrolase [Peribacillus huizhouensis]